MFFNRILVGGLILGSEPQLAVLLLGQLKFAPWQYTLAFGAPCIGGFIGSRLARPLVSRFGRHRVMLVFGTLSACWPIWLAFVEPGLGGVVLVIGIQFGLVLCMGVYNPVIATYRLDHTGEAPHRADARGLVDVDHPRHRGPDRGVGRARQPDESARISIAVAGILLLATPLLLPRRDLPLRRREPRPDGLACR